MNWSAVLDGVLGGVATALTWAALVFFVNLGHNQVLEYRLRRSFRSVGFAVAQNAWGVLWTNSTNVSVKVRGAAFNFSNGGYVPLSFWGQKTPRRKLRLRRFGKRRWAYRDFPAYTSDDSGGAVTLEFDTAGVWGIDDAKLARMHPLPDGAYCLLEYSTLINTKKRLVVAVEPFDELRAALERHVDLAKSRLKEATYRDAPTRPEVSEDDEGGRISVAEEQSVEVKWVAEH